MASDNPDYLVQPIGAALPKWEGRSSPPRSTLTGRYCRVEPYDLEKHASPLHAAYSLDSERRIWSYLPFGPFEQLTDYLTHARQRYLGDDPLAHAIVDLRSEQPVGQAAYMNVDSANGCIEIGSVIFSPLLQRTRVGTEAMYLLMRRAFDELGYRRCAWQCNSLNTASQAAAKRLGFTFEGIFRQVAVVKHKNRDTAWYSIVDSEWPAQKSRFERWLAPDNFDSTGRQLTQLSCK